MMTFKQHISVSKHLSSEDDLKVYLKSLSALEHITLLRSMQETYPIKAEPDVTDYIKEHFNYYDNVFDLVLGQFIMIEQILTGKFKFQNETDLDLELLTYVLRPKGEKEFDNTSTSKEAEHREAILNTPVQDLYCLLNKFLIDRDNVLFKQFSGVFYSTQDEEEDPDVISTPTPDELFNQQWYWYSIVRMLAQEDIRRYDSIYMLKMSVVLPEMSYLSQKNKIEAANQRQQAALNKL